MIQEAAIVCTMAACLRSPKYQGVDKILKFKITKQATMLRLCFLFIWMSILLKVNSQSINEDSLHLSKHLEPFRKHLDSVTFRINAKYLLNLYENNFLKNPQIEAKKSPIQDKLDDSNNKSELKSKKDWFAYSYEEIIPNDTNHILFIETEYNLQNRKELESLKSKFIESKTLKDQIYTCINYISELSRFYPSREDWRFSRSQTLNKYINYTAYLIDRLPKDTTKSYILGDFGYCLQQIDRVELQQYILGVYLKAKQGLIGPYQKYLKTNQLSDDSAYFRKYLNQGSIGNALININFYINSLLEPEEKFDFKNELYPFLKKRLFYLEQALKFFEIQKGKNNISRDYTMAEEKYLMALTSFKVFDKSKYFSSILYDRILLLKDYISKIFFPRTDSLTPRREYNLYYSLGYIFIGQKEYDYALKAFYKASEIRLNFISSLMRLEDIPVYIDIFEAIQNNKKSRSYEQEQSMADIVNLYLKIIDSEQPLNRYDSLHFHTFKLLGQSSLMIYREQLDKAGFLLKSQIKELFQDTIYTNSNPITFGLLYRLLLKTNWTPNKGVATFGIEREADSLFHLFKKNGSLDVESSYNGDEYLAEKLSNLGFIENNSIWYVKTEELNEQIDQKMSEINSLNIVRTTLNRTVENLNGAVESLEGEVGQLTRTLLVKQKENKNLDAIKISLQQGLSDSTARLKRTSLLNDSLVSKNVEIAQINKDLDQRVNRTSRILSILVILMLVLTGASVFIGRKVVTKSKEAKQLRKTNTTLEETITLNKVMAAQIAEENKENNYKLKSQKANAELKLLSSLAVNHEVDKFILELPDYIRNVKDDEKEKFVQVATQFEKYYFLNKATRNSLNNTLKSEIELSRLSAPLFLYMKGSRKQFEIITNFDDDIEILNIEVPKNSITSVIANSIKHGLTKRDSIKISVTVTRLNNGFNFVIEDNGYGFEKLNLENRPPYSGLNLVVNQFHNFNEFDNSYKIIFSSNWVNPRANEDGVIASFKMIKKWQEEILS